MDASAHDLVPHLDDLYGLAREHLFSTGQARLAGFGPGELRALIRAGVIRRLIRGWYAVAHGPDEPPPWVGDDPFETERRMHALLTTALLRSFDGRVVASHQSALVLHEVALWRSDLHRSHVARSDDEHSRHRRNAVIHPACGLPPVLIGDLPTVPVAVAIVQVGLALGPTGRRFPLESLVAADSALHQEKVTADELTEALRLSEGVPGIRAVRALLAFADGRHESVGETRMMHNLRLRGHICDPQKSVTIGGRTYRVDGKLRGHNVFVEFDGLSKYLPAGANTTQDELEARRRLLAEKERQDAISKQTGAEFVRFGWRDLDNVAAMDREINEAIQRLARRRGA